MEYKISARDGGFDTWTPVAKPAVGSFTIRIDQRLATSVSAACLERAIKWQTEIARSLLVDKD
jgi:hypothetical protein